MCIFAKEQKGGEGPSFSLVQTLCVILKLQWLFIQIFPELLYLHKKHTLLQGSNNTGSLILKQWYKQILIKLFSSPKLKAQVSFSDRLLSIRLSVNFPHFNLLQNHWVYLNQTKHKAALGWEFKFVLMKGHAILQGEIIMK